jgi:hypothetical protein
MRAITVAIGKQGINFFTEHYLKSVLIKKLHDLREDRSVYVGPGAQNEGNLQGQPVDGHWFGDLDDGAAQLTVKLSNGTLENFNPVYNGVTQGAGGAFDMNFTASNFDMKYQWSESYYWQCRVCRGSSSDDEQYEWLFDQSRGAYTVNIAELKVTIKTIFDYNPTTKVWEFKSRGGSVSSIKPGAASQVPQSSYVRLGYSPSCLATHISDQADNAILSINFVQIMTDQINGILAAIPGSGDMGDGIKYDFSLADSPPPALVFPGDHGVQLAVHGGLITPVFSPPSNYVLPNLPFPTPPTDGDAHQLIMYVSNYEIDALYSACRKAGRLNLTVGPSDLADPDLLKTQNYREVPGFSRLGDRDMEAQIAPADDPLNPLNPLTTFQEVWLFTEMYTKEPHDPVNLDPNCVMYTLYHQLPTNVWNNVSSLGTEAYASKATLEEHLTANSVDRQYFGIIEGAASRSGMVVKSNLNFKLIIKNFANPLPYISFSVQRTDVFTGLGLGINPNNQAQLLTFSLRAASFSATFIEATVPGFQWFEGFGNFWQVAGEKAYDQAMHDIGAKGSPLPIMKGLQFDFASAQLSVQEGYLSILANVKFIDRP